MLKSVSLVHASLLVENPVLLIPTGTPQSSSLRSEASLGALAVAVVASPQSVKLAEVHIGWDPARLIRLCCLAPSLAKQASVPRAGTGALCLGVGGLEGGCGALAAGESGGARGGDRYKGWNGGGGGWSRRTTGGEEVHVRGRETKQRHGVREGTVRRGCRGKRKDGGGETERRKRGKREFSYGLHYISRRLAGSLVNHTKQVGKGRAKTEL